VLRAWKSWAKIEFLSNWPRLFMLVSSSLPKSALLPASDPLAFDRVLKCPHADSAFEEAWVGRTRQVVIASLLTILGGTSTVYRGIVFWRASSADIWECEFRLLLAALITTSLVNVWVQAVQNLEASLCGRCASCKFDATPNPGEVRGQSDV
jgi:hypothetical protein